MPAQKAKRELSITAGSNNLTARVPENFIKNSMYLSDTEQAKSCQVRQNKECDPRNPKNCPVQENTRGCRLAWSRLVDLGSIDSGSNPGSPTIGPSLFCKNKLFLSVFSCFLLFSTILRVSLILLNSIRPDRCSSSSSPFNVLTLVFILCFKT